MFKALLLSGTMALVVGPLAAQTIPTPTTTPPEPTAPTPAEPIVPTTPTKPADGPWLVFDEPPVAETQPSKTTQGVNYVPLDADIYRLIDRYAIKFGPDSFNDPHTSVRPYTRAAAARLGERILGTETDTSVTVGVNLSRADRFNAEYLLKDNWMNSAQGAALNESAKPVFTHFYRNQTDLYHVQTDGFALRVNPVALLQVGKDSDISGLRYVNTRGLQLEGTIDQKLGFYTFLADNQMGVPQYVQDRILRDQIVPHEGYFKPFKAAVIGPNSSQYDFFTARGGITYAAGKHINLQLAHDRNFIGNGYRSLILSDYSAPYFFLKANTRIWKFNYQNLFAELTAQKENEDQVYPKKYMALHHLSFDVTPNLNIGVFESTILGSAGVDSVTSNGKIAVQQRRRFELQYLNPVIFYRAIEQNVGSADNAILGLDFKWNILHTAQLYGQLVLDEFKISEIRAGNGWWANKQAFQLGGKYIDVAGLRNLDLQLEFNYIRPFMYQHEDIYTSYQHYQQPLAHPMGANVAEMLGVLSYQPLPRLMLVGKAFYSVQGLDDPRTTPAGNYGSNVLLSYNVRPTDAGNLIDYGYQVGSGNKSRLLHADFTATYQPRLNLFVDAKVIARNQTYTLTPNRNGSEVFASMALRWNIAQRLHEF